MARTKAPPRPLVLGEVKAPSGMVLVIDTGLLWLWSHDQVPVMPEGAYNNEELVRRANAGKDFRVEGPDALAAGQAYSREWHPLYLFDRPADMTEHFAAFAKEHGFRAWLEPLAKRMPHRERVDRVLDHGGGAGEVRFQGVWACAVALVPPKKVMRVVGRRMPADTPDAGRWREVSLEVRPRTKVAKSVKVGTVAVDEARLMFADVDALGDWEHNDSLDGMADFVFWGRDAAVAAKRARAPKVADEVWGWTDLPLRQALQRGQRFLLSCAKNGWQLAHDYRPHSHHYQVMAQVRASATESGTLEVGPARMCTFMTSWGDGIFPVYRDLGARGELVRVRIDLGNDNIVRRQRRFEERFYGAFAKTALVSRRVADEGQPVGFLFREEPLTEGDSGWRVYAGNEPPSEVRDLGRWAEVPLRDLVDRENALEELLRSPPRTAFHRRPGQPFVPATDFFSD